MAGRLGRRVVHFANLPIKLLMPTTFDYIKEIALKTIPSASKIEIKRVLESLYGFEVDEVRTLNMDGKKKKRGGLLLAKPDYKKAYVTLKHPLSISPDVYPIRLILDDREKMRKESKSGVVDEVEKHWLEGSGNKVERRGGYKGKRAESGNRGNYNVPKFNEGRRAPRVQRDSGTATAKFPWTSMRSAASSK